MDTEGNFRPERVEAIAERFGLDPSETLENVIVTRVFNHEQQIERAHVRLRRLKLLTLTHDSFSVFVQRDYGVKIPADIDYSLQTPTAFSCEIIRRYSCLIRAPPNSVVSDMCDSRKHHN